jgi:hypothetical protein
VDYAVQYPVVQVVKKFLNNRSTSLPMDSSRSGAACRHHEQSERLAATNARHWAIIHDIIRAIVAGMMRGAAKASEHEAS